jgi:hypothetical protein
VGARKIQTPLLSRVEAIEYTVAQDYLLTCMAKQLKMFTKNHFIGDVGCDVVRISDYCILGKIREYR